MNILHIVQNVVGVGTYWRSLAFARHLAGRGHSITVMAASRHNRLRLTHKLDAVPGVTLIETPDWLPGRLRSGWDAWNTLRRLAWLSQRNFDVVHAFEARPTVLFPSLYAKYIKHMPLVMDWCDWYGRGGVIEELTNPAIRAVLGPVDTFFELRFRTQAVATTVICTTLRDMAINLGVPANQITLLPNPMDGERIHPVPRNEARARLELPLDWPIVGYTGTLFQRDAEFMASAFDRVCETHAQARLLVFGYCPIPIKPLVRYPERVIQTGFIQQAHMNDYFGACDVCWQPCSLKALRASDLG